MHVHSARDKLKQFSHRQMLNFLLHEIQINVADCEGGSISKRTRKLILQQHMPLIKKSFNFHPFKDFLGFVPHHYKKSTSLRVFFIKKEQAGVGRSYLFTATTTRKRNSRAFNLTSMKIS